MKKQRVNRLRSVFFKSLGGINRIAKMAEKGDLGAIGRRAYNRSRSMGLTVTIVENNTLLQITPEGKKIKIKDLPLVTTKYKRGDVIRINTTK